MRDDPASSIMPAQSSPGSGMRLSAGKRWSLRRMSDKRGLFAMIAIDHRLGMARLVEARRAELPGDPRLAPTAWEDIGRIKQALIEELSPVASAVLLDPEHAYQLAARSVDPARGLLIAIEQSVHHDEPGGRRTLPFPGWSVQTVKRMGADGVKLKLWHNAGASVEVAAHQVALAEQVGAACREHDIAFMLQPMPYALPGDAASIAPAWHAGAVLAAVEEFRHERYGVDLFRLDSPVAAEGIADPDGDSSAASAAQALFDRIDLLLARPWVLRSGDTALEPFRRVLTYAARSGASGFLAGRSLWRRAVQEFPDWERLRWSLRQDVLPFVQRIDATLDQYGRPWTSRS